MYLPIPSQPDCLSAWREAVRQVDGCPGHEAHNVLIDIADPVARTNPFEPQIAVIEDFLQKHDKSVQTVANTIFPESLYLRHGSPKFFSEFETKVLARVRKNDRWSGYYFERMMCLPVAGKDPRNQLLDIIRRLKDPNVKALNKFELSVFDPLRDVDDSPYGGQCLSHASFKIIKGTRTLTLSVLYRNHYYIEKLLGNLIGLGRLMAFVAKEAGMDVGSLTVLSTHADIDQPGGCSRGDIAKLLVDFDQAAVAAVLP